MSDPGIAEFKTRIARIHKAHATGYGFEAEGALGRSFYTRSHPRYRRRVRMHVPVLRPLLIAVFVGTLMKAAFLYQLGSVAYADRVADLMAGQGVDRIGGWLMQADPVTTAIARQISLFGRLDG
ncbi:hypothetical protein EEB11_05185 [Pseudotabrizicola sediminis]|uniref:Uncharacterized protein n=1 Tax=Pseudotabrizicola sediminis TaxID=2486418 RepID=A0ABY2KPF6_9RHOB|nr:hypothetical protein [Pseudotabrizicola sediminis]TGD44102.1 hypothetical protein EEB11_05185 [Pseudotabrizicola sediminis]